MVQGMPDAVLVAINPASAKTILADLTHAVVQVELGIGEMRVRLQASSFRRGHGSQSPSGLTAQGSQFEFFSFVLAKRRNHFWQTGINHVGQRLFVGN